MPVQHSPSRGDSSPDQDRPQDPTVAMPPAATTTDSNLPKIAVLRRQRTMNRNAIQAEWLRVSNLDPAVEAERRQLVKSVGVVSDRIDRLRQIDEVMSSHPLLPDEELDREAAESEDATSVALNVKNDIATLLASYQQIQDGHSDRSASIAHPSRIQAESSQIADAGSLTPPPGSNVTYAAAPPSLDVTPDIFDGRPGGYRMWRAQVKNYLDRRTAATGADKLVALSRLLRGAPKQLVSALRLTDANYQVALELLDQNYAASGVEEKALIASTMTVPTVRHPGDVAAMRELVNATQRTILSMEAAGIPLEDFAITYEASVRAALPAEIVFEFEERERRSAQSDGVQCAAAASQRPAKAAAERLTALLASLRRLVCLREQLAASGKQQHPNVNNKNRTQLRSGGQRSAGGGLRGDHSDSYRSFRQQRNYTMAPTVMDRQRQLNKPSSPCFFCSGEHWASQCSADLTYQQRCDMLVQQDRCAVCFRRRHSSPRDCKGVLRPCSVCGSKKHRSVMHNPAPSAGSSRQPSSGSPQKVAAGSVLAVVRTAPSRAVVMTASAVVVCGSERVNVRLFLDTGSMLTFAKPQLIKQLKGIRPIECAELELQAFASKHTVSANRYELRLAGIHGDATISLLTYAYDFQVDPPADGPASMHDAIRQFALKHQLADPSIISDGQAAEVSVLVGIDQFYKIAHLNEEKEIAEGLVAKNSQLGWLISGSFGPLTTRGDIYRVLPVCCAATLSKPAKDVQRLWTLEAIGVGDSNPSSSGSFDEDDALRQFRESVVYDGSSYQVAVPKRDSISTLDNNLETARNRLMAKRRSLLKNPAKFERYHAELMAFVKSGFAREVTELDVTAPSAQDNTYFMPHQSVVKSSEKGEKWRVVFDCSAAAPGKKSLNAHLLTGPNLNPNIAALLLNFRLHRIALSTDIAQAYMTIRLAPADRPLFRFLWQGPADAAVRAYEMQRVTWGAAPSGFLLAAVLREHFKLVDSTDAYKLGESMYFDDLLISFATEEETVTFIDHIVRRLRSAGMGLVKWKSNSPAVLGHLEQSGLPTSGAELGDSTLLKVLGIAWAPASDHFRFQLTQLIGMVDGLRQFTKRMILRVVATIYDPIGWLLPFTLRGKLIIQQLWTQSLKWDDPVDCQLLDAFRTWAAEIETLSAIRIPRWYGMPGRVPVSYQLHVFGDASEKAFAAAAYVQTLYDDGSSSSALLMARSRIAPREKISLPRLELMAALLAARLRAFIVESLHVRFDRIVHYTDSAVSYYWCTAEEPARWKTFVCNRVREVQQLTSPEEWLHVAGTSNIADIATRGVPAKDLVKNRQWWFGPTWLADPEEKRPVSRLQCGSNKSESIVNELRMVVAPAVTLAPLVDLHRVGSWEKAVRVVACVLDFAQRCRRQPPTSDAARRAAAELYLIKTAQHSHFAAEIAAVRAGDNLPRSSKINAFRLFIDEDGLLRARTRLTLGPHLTFDERNPIVIPGDSRLATLLVLHHHRVNAHFGVTAILNALRRRYWILRGRQVVRALLRACVVCRRTHGRSADQVQGPLPAERASIEAPFATTGVDFCGPFFTRSKAGTHKNYIALFTCASVRAVHLELVPDMSTPQTHLAIRRFIATYPACRQFISDNGRSFVRAAADIKRLFNSFRDPDARELLARHRIDWVFTCPRAPWRNGFTERLVGVTKTALKKTLGRSLIHAEELRTILVELSAVVNDRPLSYVTSEADEARALTPAMFLRAGPSASPLCAAAALDRLGPNGRLTAEAPEAEQLRRALLERTTYFRALSVRWYREYLLQLRSANTDRAGKARPLRDGDVCLLREDNIPRVRWNLVRVVEGRPGRDGAVRTYTVRFGNGHESRRAAQLLIPLECDDTIPPPQEGE